MPLHDAYFTLGERLFGLDDENALHALGFRDFRVRLYHGAARIQVTAEQLPLVLEQREAVSSALDPAFDGVLLDLMPRGIG